MMQTTQVLERYRRLFGSLPNLSLTLSEADISAAQEAANTPEAWRAHFLSHSSANLRRALSHALLELVSICHSDDVQYERDEGMMEGDDGGYTSPASLLEEDKSSASSILCYDLLGAPAGQSSSESDALPYQSTSTVLLAEQALRQLTTFAEGQQSQAPETQTFAPLFSELRAIVLKARTRELRHPDQLADALQTLIEDQNAPETVREQLKSFISDARRCAQACHERALVRSQADALLTGLLSSNAPKSSFTPAVALHTPRKRPRAPSFANVNPRPAPSASLLEILGNDHPIAKNVYNLRRYHAWRTAVVSKFREMRGDQSLKKEPIISQTSPRAKSPRLRGKKPRKDLIEIFNDVGQTIVPVTQDRHQATLLSSCALVLSHSGFSQASTSALNLLVDVVEEFIMQIGASLSAVRENVENSLDTATPAQRSRRRKTSDDRAQEFRIICDSGAKGGFLDLLYYTKIDAHRTAMKIHDAEKRLELHLLSGKESALLMRDHAQAKLIDDTALAELHNLPRPNEVKGGVKGQDGPVSEEDIKFDGEPFVFGYLCESVRLDVLGDVTVPVRAVYGNKKSIKDGVASGRVERVHRSPRPKSKNVSLQGTPSSSPSGAPFTPVKAEAKFVDIGDG